MARPLSDVVIPSTQTDDTQQRAVWREKAKARYWAKEETRLAKIAAVDEHRRRHPERVREVKRLSGMRQRRGIQRAYRKDEGRIPE